MALVSNYDFIIKPRVKPRRSIDARYCYALDGMRGKIVYRTDRPSKAVESDREAIAIQREDERNKAFEPVMRADINSKYDLDYDVSYMLKVKGKDNRYMYGKRLNPATAKKLIAKGAVMIKTDVHNVFFIMNPQDATVYGMAAFPTESSQRKCRKKHMH